MSASTVSVVLQNRRRTSYGATHAACACKCARAHAPWASMHGLTSELSSTCGRRSPSRMCWMTAALQPRKSRPRCSPSACGTRKISSHAAARTSAQKCIGGASQRLQESRDADAPWPSPRRCTHTQHPDRRQWYLPANRSIRRRARGSRGREERASPSSPARARRG